MKTDSLFYRLFQSSPGLVLELAGLDYSDAQAYRFCSEEIKQTAFRLDGILTPPQENIFLLASKQAHTTLASSSHLPDATSRNRRKPALFNLLESDRIKRIAFIWKI